MVLGSVLTVEVPIFEEPEGNMLGVSEVPPLVIDNAVPESIVAGVLL